MFVGVGLFWAAIWQDSEIRSLIDRNYSVVICWQMNRSRVDQTQEALVTTFATR